jgi:hypothetical protein
MIRPAMVAIPTAALVGAGCASPPATVPANVDPDKLVNAIAQRGQDNAPAVDDPPGTSYHEPPTSTLVGNCGQGAALVLLGTGTICLYLLYAIAQSHPTFH